MMNTITMNNYQDLPFSLIPKNDNELLLLKNYHAHITEQVDKMELHPSHKQDVQKVLTKSILMFTQHSAPLKTPKPVSLYTRVTKRLFG